MRHARKKFVEGARVQSATAYAAITPSQEKGDRVKVTFCPLFSGSSGNAVYMGTQGTHILVDAGVSAAAIERALSSIGVSASELDGILITHEHTDHTQGGVHAVPQARHSGVRQPRDL